MGCNTACQLECDLEQKLNKKEKNVKKAVKTVENRQFKTVDKQVAQCAYMFRRGASKGTRCVRGCTPDGSSKFCTIHVGKVMDVQLFPTEIMRCIVSSVNDKNGIKATFARLCKLGATCKEYKNVVEEHCCTIYQGLAIDPQKHAIMDQEGMSIKRRLHLLLESGCTRCNTPRITKVHWPFPLRLCQSCIRAITVPDYILENRYKLMDYSGARYIECTGWNRFNGETMYHAYLIKDVERDVGVTLHNLEATIEQRSRNHLVEIATALDVSLEHMLHVCERYLNVVKFPNRRETQMVYWRELSKNALVQRGYYRKRFVRFFREAEMVTSREEHAEFLRYIDDSQVELDQLCDKQKYDEEFVKVVIELQNKLQSEPYFCNLYIYAALPQLASRPDKDDIERLRQDVPILESILAEFMDHHRPDVPFENADAGAIQVWHKLLRYPAREPHVPDFLRAWDCKQKTFLDPEVTTWSDVVKMVNSYTSGL